VCFKYIRYGIYNKQLMVKSKQYSNKRATA